MSRSNLTQGYSPEAAAEALGVVTAETIRNGLRAGIIQGVKVGPRWLISEETLARIRTEGLPAVSRPRGSTAKPQTRRAR